MLFKCRRSSPNALCALRLLVVHLSICPPCTHHTALTPILLIHHTNLRAAHLLPQLCLLWFHVGLGLLMDALLSAHTLLLLEGISHRAQLSLPKHSPCTEQASAEQGSSEAVLVYRLH